MIVGVVRGRDALRHPVTLAHDFGWRTLLRTVRAAVSPWVRVTFLEIACGGRP